MTPEDSAALSSSAERRICEQGIDGLAAVVEGRLRLNPGEKNVLFCGTRPDRIKGLVFEGGGYLLYKRLDNGRFCWLRNEQEAMSVTQEQFDWLMKGMSIRNHHHFMSCWSGTGRSIMSKSSKRDGAARRVPDNVTEIRKGGYVLSVSGYYNDSVNKTTDAGAPGSGDTPVARSSVGMAPLLDYEQPLSNCERDTGIVTAHDADRNVMDTTGAGAPGCSDVPT